MSISLYDAALLKKIRGWVKDKNVKITGVDETRRLFEYIADETNDKPIALPLIALRRDPNIDILQIAKRPLTYDGMTLNATAEKSDQFNAVPIKIGYQIDIYTRYLEEADEYTRNFIFNIINFPKVTIEIPYNDSNLTADSNIRLEDSFSDNSDISERLIAGQFYRFTLRLYIDDAYLYSYRTRDNLSIEYDLDIS